MPTPQRLYHGSVRALSVLFVLLGLAMMVLTLAAGGGPVSLGFLMGLAFVGVGAGRLWALSRISR
jgi:hypothetical protein